MKKIALFCLLLSLAVGVSGCVPLMIGGAAGALGAYAVGKDTVQGETDKSYDSIWSAAYSVARIRGKIRQEDNLKGSIELDAESSKVSISLIRLTQATTRLKIKARKHGFPNLELAQDMFVKIMEEAK